MKRPTPSSVHFSMAHSMRSNLKMERAKVRFATGTTESSPQGEFDALIFDFRDCAAAHYAVYGNIELLTHSGPQDPRKMFGVGSDQGSAISGTLVSNPASSGHVLEAKPGGGDYPNISLTLLIKLRRCGLF